MASTGWAVAGLASKNPLLATLIPVPGDFIQTQYMLSRIKSAKRLFNARRLVPRQCVNVVPKIEGIQMGSSSSLAAPTLLAGAQISLAVSVCSDIDTRPGPLYSLRADPVGPMWQTRIDG